MRIAVIVVVSSVLFSGSLLTPAYSDVAVRPDTTAVAATAPADPTHAASDDASAAQTAEQEARQKKADAALFKKLGFFERTVKGETRYCKKDFLSGSRIDAVTTCRSGEQIKAALQAQKQTPRS